MRLSALLLLAALLLPLPVTAESALRVFLLDDDALDANRQKLVQGDPQLAPALTQQADKMLRIGPFSVIDKDATPPSGDEHDYQSIGPYWWPDPDKPDGLPYIRKDGQVNPERRAIGDADRFKTMRHAVVTLSYAWYFTGEETYAEHAAKLLRIWYLDPATRMNPNMQYAQAIPGRTEGRGIGIVDAASQPLLIDAIGLLQTSQAWTKQDQQGMARWFADMLDWLRTSKHGRDESRTKNNHATQYDVQVASYALFVGKPDIARQVLADVAKKRIATQIESDGSQPHELKRTHSWDYSAINTLNFARLAHLGELLGIDLWQTPQDQPSITDAIDYLLPYAIGQQKWKHKQIKSFDPQQLLKPLLYAAKQDNAGRYAKAAYKLLDHDSLERLLYLNP